MSAQLGVFSVLLVLLMAPGLVVGLASGLRGWIAVTAAPLLTFGVIAVSASAVPSILGRWSIWGLLIATVLAAAIGFGVRLVARRWVGADEPKSPLVPWSRLQHAGVAAAVLFTAALGLAVTARATHMLTDVHQFWDASFHANAVRFIEETGQSQPSALKAINDQANAGFTYPNGFHILGATVLGITGAPITIVLNTQSALLAGLLALSIVGLVRVAGGRPLLAVGSALAAGMFSAFPYDLEFFGPIWPFATGLALMPVLLALLIHTLDNLRPALVITAALGICGLVTLHPSITLAAVIFGVCYLVQRWATARRVPLPEVGMLIAAGVLSSIYAVPQLLGMASTAQSDTFEWPLHDNAADSLGQLFFLGHEAARPQWWLVAAMVVGLIGIRKLKPMYWWLAGGLIFSGLFVLTTSYKGPLVATLTGFWWNDRWRFAALVVPAMVVLAGHGLVFARDALSPLLRKTPEQLKLWQRLAAGALVLVVFGVLSNGFYVERNARRVIGAYNGGYPTVTKSEQEGIDKLATIVGKDDLVMNDPRDGSAWMWALDDVHPVFGHVLGDTPTAKAVGEDRVELFTKFNKIDTDPKIRSIVEKMRIKYVFEGWGFAAPFLTRAEGMKDLDKVKSLQLVFSNEHTKIYQIKGADQP
ncbi:hypothetical protein LFM09_27135 [Lentzea alba]|uniref:DUF6541 family protein n=1 Tax=Lentzea alba TaxID=2714351 RepID=UPI0039BF867B